VQANGTRWTSADLFDERNEFVHAVTLPSSEFDKLFRLLDDGYRAGFRRPFRG